MAWAIPLESDTVPREFRRRVGAERPLLMLPLNVVLAGRVRGGVSADGVAAALNALRDRHPFLGVRVDLDEDGRGAYTTEGVPPIPVRVADRDSDDDWLPQVAKEFRTPFPIEAGPLLRCVLVRSEAVSELILCGHHAICDGRSLVFLLRDLLTVLATGAQPEGRLPEPPPIDASTVPRPPRTSPLVRFVVRKLNERWAKKRIRFGERQMRQMHGAFWAQHREVPVLSWQMTSATTSALIERCRHEGVTVNSALWTAFLAAECDVRGGARRCRRLSGMAVSTRDKLRVPVGEQLGFYASSLTVALPHADDVAFWDHALRVHARIERALARTNLFRMLAAADIHPTLVDSLYFTKYGLLDERLPRWLLRKLRWHEVTYGCALTNVGRLDVPTDYGPHGLEAVYGPCVFSDVEDAVVGVVTVGGRLSCMLTTSGYSADEARQLRDAARGHLERAISDTESTGGR